MAYKTTEVTDEAAARIGQHFLTTTQEIQYTPAGVVIRAGIAECEAVYTYVLKAEDIVKISDR